MRFERRNLVLGALALGLLAVDFGTLASAPEARVAVPIFEQLQGAEPVRIEIEAPDVEAPLVLYLADGAELERAPSMAWRMPIMNGWPVRDGLASNLLRGIENLETLDLLASDVAGHAAYGVTEDKAVRVRIYDQAGTILVDLLQGGLAPGGRASYLRAYGSDDVWRVPRLGQRISAKPTSWMEPRWMPFNRSRLQVDAIVLSGTAIEGSVRLERSEGSQSWLNPQEEIVSPAQVRLLLESLEALFVAEVLEDGGEGVGEPRLSVRLEGVGDGEPWVGHFGATGEDGRVLAIRAPMDWVVAFPAAAVDPIVNSAVGLSGK
ncbi:MAG: hypothetical protein ACI8QC_001615 [Planctomycetota bacterium]|jgi:hypothetical protein